MRTNLILGGLGRNRKPAGGSTTRTIGDNTGGGLVNDFSGSESGGGDSGSPTGANPNAAGWDTTSGAAWIGFRFTGLNATNIPGAITAASLFVRINDAFGAGTLTAYELLRAWVAAEATWNVWTTGNNWTTAGATGAGDRSASIGSVEQPNTDGIWLEIVLTAAVIEAQRTGTNNGVQVYGTAACDFVGVTGTNGLRPYLSVTYTP